MSRILSAFIFGFLFALGLGVAGATRPETVIGFLDITGKWDPTLLFVLVAAVGSYGIAFRLIMRRRQKPVFEPVFSVPTRRDLTPSLIAGSVLFGTGWGLTGYCPAPALTSAAGGHARPLIFLVAMAAGMLLFKAFEGFRARSAETRAVATAPVRSGLS